ncbi:MAG: MFS transporter [Bryobacteraceae bacterium]|nr:MFS transporter [Bryobacteraceae bacterium]
MTETRLPRVFRALAHRNFRLFAGGQLLSLTGTWMQNAAQSWLVYRLTGSSLLLGTVSFANQVPIFLLSPLGGAAADRYNRRQVVLGTQVAAMALAFLLAALTLSGRVQIWHIVTLALLGGVVQALDTPARQSLFIELVGAQDLLNAIALNSSMFNTARMLGPAVAGVVVASAGEGWCFLANAVSYLAVIAGLLMMRLAPSAAPAAQGRMAAELLEGFRFAWHAQTIRTLLLMLGISSLLGSPYVVLLPVFARDVLGGGPRTLGLLMGAVGLGALVGALSVAAKTGVRGLGRTVRYASAGFGLSLLAFSMSRELEISILLLIPTGFSLMTQMACSNTLIQTIVPDRIRGRVMALYSMMIMGMAPFGALLAGFLAQHLGAPATVALGGAACLAASVVYWRQLASRSELGLP